MRRKIGALVAVEIFADQLQGSFNCDIAFAATEGKRMTALPEFTHPL